MTDSAIMWLGLAAILLLTAHMIRAFRWSLLYPRGGEAPDQRGLLVGLGVGYALNAILPLRIGEVVRGVVTSRARSSRFSETAATIVAERFCDILIVAVYVVAGTAAARGGVPKVMVAFAAAVVLAAILAIALRHSARLRRLLWTGAGIFNGRIRLGVANFVWSSAEILVGGTLVRWQFTTATMAMWATYIASYQAFARYIGVPVGKVADALLLQPLSSFLAADSSALPQTQLQLYVLGPVAALLTGQLLQGSLRKFAPRPPRLSMIQPRSHFASSTRYRSLSGYNDFLDSLFSDCRAAVRGFGMAAVEDCIVHHYYRGGSDALTALVETDDRLLIRKFAMGSAALKLRQQADWLERHSICGMPVVPVVGRSNAPGSFSYDMPLYGQTSEFHEAIHSRPLREGNRTLLKIINCMDELHAASESRDAASEQVDGYLHEKAMRNAECIVQFARSAMGTDSYRINGEEYDLKEWDALRDLGWLRPQVRARRQAGVHGDLTIENIVISPQHDEGFYVIDPNPENVFDTPLIDWAKMMQSLHLDYEGLNKSASSSFVDGGITLPIMRSEAYASLHKLLESEIVSRFSADTLREVYFHELVNYLRLTPYKMRQSTQRGLAFFGCTSLLLRKYRTALA
jgi:aminoglycoside phosphotransferase (APT) family kinase protein